LQLWQEAPSSTTRMSRHLAVLSYLAACLTGPFRTVLTYFSTFIPFLFSYTSLGEMLRCTRSHFLPRTTASPQHEQVFGQRLLSSSSVSPVHSNVQPHLNCALICEDNSPQLPIFVDLDPLSPLGNGLGSQEAFPTVVFLVKPYRNRRPS
jgi:hypothetical protein